MFFFFSSSSLSGKTGPEHSTAHPTDSLHLQTARHQSGQPSQQQSQDRSTASDRTAPAGERFRLGHVGFCADGVNLVTLLRSCDNYQLYQSIMLCSGAPLEARTCQIVDWKIRLDSVQMLVGRYVHKMRKDPKNIHHTFSFNILKTNINAGIYFFHMYLHAHHLSLTNPEFVVTSLSGV